MAITITRYQRRPPEVEAVVYEKAADAAEIAAWVNGTARPDGSILIPEITGGEWVATLGSAIVRHPGGSVEVTTLAQLESLYTKKLV